MSQGLPVEAEEIFAQSKEALDITLLGSEWNSSAGGLSTLNRELAIHLSQQPNVRVSLLVPEGACKDEDKKEAQNFGINVLHAEQQPGFSEPLDWLGFPPQDHRMDVVVGHGVKLGRQITVIKRSPQFQNCKWVHVVHTAPEDLSKYKAYDNPTSRGEQKHWDEVGLCKYADLVVPVGPRLKRAYSSYLQGCKKVEDIFEIAPGLFNREFGNLVQQAKVESDDDFKVLLCGRGDDEDFELKGYDIAVQAFADKRLKGKLYYLLFVGAPDGKQDEVRRRLLDCGITDQQLTVRKFVQNRARMKDLFCEVDLVIMPSKSEGFGLVALEALSAGLPVLVGSNSGFARAIKSIPLGVYSIVDSEDPGKWAEAIEGVSVRHKVCLEESKLLREAYGKEYCWKKQCEEFVDKLWSMVHESATCQDSASDNLVEQQPTGAVTSNRENANESGQRRSSKSNAEEGINASEIRQRSKLHEPLPPVPICKDKRVSETSREELSLPEFGGINASEIRQRSKLHEPLPPVPIYMDKRVSETSREELSLPEFGDNLIKLLISVSNLTEEQKEKVYGLLALQVQTFVKSRDYSSNKPKGVRALTKFIVDVYKVSLEAVNMGSLEIIVDCPTLRSLERLWNDYLSGHLNKVAECYLVTDEIKTKLGLETINLKTTIDEENYLACRKFLTKIQESATCQDSAADNLVEQQSTGAVTSNRENANESGQRRSSKSNAEEGIFVRPRSAMDPANHFAEIGQLVMECGDFPKAQHYLSMALEHCSRAAPQLYIPLLVQRAECSWQLGEVQASVHDMEEAISRGLPREGNHSQWEMANWTNHGFSLYRKRDFRLAEQCINVAFYFQPAVRPEFAVETFLCRGLIRYELNNESGAQQDINIFKKIDSRLAEGEAVKQKESAFEEFKQRSYEKSLRLFRLALMLHPTRSSNWVKFKRSIESHQATAYFKVGKYIDALEIGEQSYMSNKTLNAGEGKRWKERGNELSKESKAVDLAIRCYSLALNYTPKGEKELKSTILSNRSLMYIKKGEDKEALRDATRCVECNPKWAKAHYRLGCCLSRGGQLSKAMESLSISLELLLKDPKSEEPSKQDTFHQLLSVALRLSGDTTSILYTIPQNLSQKMIDKAVTEKDWNRLHLLFMGGGGEMCFKKGWGGLGTGCDARNVPLEEVVDCDFPRLEQFISTLLDHNAVASQRAFDAAIELEKPEVVDVLMKRKVKSTEASKSGRQRSFKAEAQEALLKGYKRTASHLFELSLKLQGKTVAERRETLEILCELYFEQNAFTKCLDTGYKLKATYQENEKEIKQAALWKNRGNQLHKANEYELMAKYCSLAMEFTPLSDSETLTALLSNRCVAFISLKQWEEALADAEKCITIRPQWFKGYSRHGTCLFNLNRFGDALGSFCKAYTHAPSNKQKHLTAKDVVLTAMKIPGGEAQITCTFSPSLLLQLVKEATEKNEWKKLKFFYLGTKSNKSSRGIAFECDASFVPLDLLIASDIEDLDELVKHLLLRGAPADGLRDCKRPPLLVAMEVMKFNLAVTLLRNNADLSCIVGNEIFIHKEGQPKQWYHLGRKALDKTDHKKAVMLLNMCLHLPHDHTEVILLAQAYHSLAEAHFKLNEHEKAIAAGKECYKLYSVKSEEEAKRWQMRASELFDKGFYSICKECINLSVMYTTNDLSLSLLLCQRSKVENQLGNYADGLEDAKNATKMTPTLLEGYLCQVKCLRHLERPSETMKAINESVRRTTDEELIRGLLSDALDIAVTLDEGTSALTAPFPSHLLTEVTNKVIETKDWDKLRVLYIGGGGPSTQSLGGGGGLATNIDASSVPLGEVIHHFPSKQPLLISALLENGASANKIKVSQIIPLEEALKREDLPLVEKLVQKGGNCCEASHDGDPMIHKALKKDLQNGNLRFLEAMLGSNIPGFQSVRDSDGNTLYHLVCTGKPTKPRRDAIRILRDANVNPHFRNKKGKRAIDMLFGKDLRRKIISDAMSSIKPEAPDLVSPRIDSENASAKQEKFHVVTLARTEDDEWSVSSDDNKERKSRQNKISKIDEKQQWRIEMRENVTRLTESLSNNLLFPALNALDERESNESLEKMYVSADIREHERESLNDKHNSICKDNEVFTGSPERKDTRPDVIDDESIKELFIYDKRETEIDFNSPFENLSWEVDCTGDVWKIMRSKNVGNNLRKRIVDKIRMLATGRWTTENLCKRLEGQAMGEGIQLYETRLTESQRIIWEKTVAFSNRLSDSPEHRLKAENPGGRIYCDIIRVWDIVFDHDKLQRSIERIIKSHNRGMECLIKTKLKGIPMDKAASSSNLCLPSKYTEVEEGNQASKLERKKKEAQKTTIDEDLSKIFYPPASANDQDYHILKFYSFNTPLVKSVLESDSSTKIDFPFKITELAYAIVNLQPDPSTPIILLGRSGTGKTTCCLYRLWNHFQRYWEKALTAGPYIRKCLAQEEAICQDNEEEEETKKQSIQQGTCIKDHPSASNTSLGQDADVWTASATASEAREDSEESHLQKRISYAHHLPSEEIQFKEQSLQDTSSTNLEHLHQVFITKNTVLCREVEKNFKELCHACPAETPRVNFEGRPIPWRIQDIHEEEWPLFVNSRDWLLLLDASLPGEPFFRRAPDGSLIRKIQGWGEEDNPLQLIPSLETDEESGDEEGEESTENVRDEEVRTKRTGDQKRERDPRREITYQVFRSEIWPQMIKSSKIDYHPTLVWTEIRSFLKGSAEALLGGKGVLTENDYMLLGKKKASNFTADRGVVYNLFLIYQRVLSSKRMFDEADFVFNIYQRLQNIPAPEWSVHEFYVDETEDFTQAELSLLIRCCRSPNEMFFTGDTAQSIMRGIAFRFEDLKALFHNAKEAAAMKDVRLKLRVPKTLYQLACNYRSHAGILHLASSVVDLLLDFFPESFDKLKRDEGLFHGPKPVLLESCSPTDLALLLQGNQRQSPRIEFGAHQVVLVVSNEARKAMPEELKQALVLTIYEAKGLEFDDVLIYNFFKDSQAGKEWRVVTSYLENQSKANALAPTGLAEITEDEVAVHHSRPLKFDPEKHKVLNSEFKYLYTAITRARVNVWFFDEDEDARAPVFEYFRRLDLVKVVSLSENDEGTELPRMFATKSTPEEWQKGGHRFYKKGLWELAMQCFRRADDKSMLEKCKARIQAAEAIKFRYTSKERMRAEFLKASESFLKCGMPKEAGICLNNAQEFILLAKLYEKMPGKLQEAARLFKEMGFPIDSSRCYESQNNYRDAIETLCHAGHFDQALKVLERFNILSSSSGPEGLEGVIPPKSTRTAERLCHLLADKHFNRGNREEMNDVLQHLPPADRITFLKKRGCISEIAKTMEKDY